MSTETQPVRVSQEDYHWLMENRGSGSVAAKIHDVIAYYCYHEGKPQPQGNGACACQPAKTFRRSQYRGISMQQDSVVTEKPIVAGVPAAVFAALPADDQAFLQLLEGAGLDLDTCVHKAGGAKP